MIARSVGIMLWTVALLACMAFALLETFPGTRSYAVQTYRPVQTILQTYKTVHVDGKETEVSEDVYGGTRIVSGGAIVEKEFTIVDAGLFAAIICAVIYLLWFSVSHIIRYRASVINGNPSSELREHDRNAIMGLARFSCMVLLAFVWGTVQSRKAEVPKAPLPVVPTTVYMEAAAKITPDKPAETSLRDFPVDPFRKDAAVYGDAPATSSGQEK